MHKELIVIQAILWFILANAEHMTRPNGWGDELATLTGCACLAYAIDFGAMWRWIKVKVRA